MGLGDYAIDTGAWYGARKSAYGIEYGLGYRKDLRMVTNFDLLIYYGVGNDDVKKLHEVEELRIQGAGITNRNGEFKDETVYGEEFGKGY